ncbi:hypothetical protein [Bacillus toyonensis]|uniref:hypothetical protein n=1 Tax=Bacillus toyonensis TaxID=155322 RepID=UPI0015D50B8D|nr:hypothetical protein [Bacillus toyonensis]
MTNCFDYIIWYVRFVESSNEAEKNNFIRASDENKKAIWGLIDKYIEEENKLIDELV